MSRKIILTLAIWLIQLLSGGFVYAESPFRMDLEYQPGGGILKIDLERLSQNEMKDFMQRLVITPSASAPIEESLIDQNHLNAIVKMVPLTAVEGDTITVDLYYGSGAGAVVSRTLTVGQPTLAEEAQSSVLISDDDTLSSDPPLEIQPPVQEKEEEETFGYSPPKEKEYGSRNFGYEGSKERYGYTLEENDAYKSDAASMDGTQGKSYGYTDPGQTDVGQKGFGYSDYGYKGDSTPYGRTTYETPKVWNK